MEPVRKTLSLSCSVDDAFTAFTQGLGSWWPTDTHSIHPDRVVDAVVDPRLDGRVFERLDDGSEFDWGVITAWDPPSGFSISWKPNLDPDAHRTTWSIALSPNDDGSTLELTHSGWERFGAQAEQVRTMYETGWDVVLAGLMAATN